MCGVEDGTDFGTSFARMVYNLDDIMYAHELSVNPRYLPETFFAPERKKRLRSNISFA